MLAGRSDNAVGQVFNVGGPDVINLLHLAEMLVSLVPGARYELVPFPADRKAIDIGDYFADDTKIRSELNWQPRVSLEVGLETTVSYYQKHRHQYWSSE
jgi:nucleoside-diphosphate-sugar epimerase